MTTKDKNMKWVLIGFITLSLLILGSIIVENNHIDVVYFIGLMIYICRYVYIKVKC